MLLRALFTQLLTKSQIDRQKEREREREREKGGGCWYISEAETRRGRIERGPARGHARSRVRSDTDSLDSGNATNKQFDTDDTVSDTCD